MEPKTSKNYELSFSLDNIEDLGGGDLPVKQKAEDKADDLVPSFMELLIEHGRVEALKAYITNTWDLIDAEVCLNILGTTMLNED